MDRVPPHAAVGETVAAARSFVPKATGLVNAVLRRVAAKESRPGDVVLPAGADPVRRLALETSHPEWLVARWVAAFGEEAARAALAADEEDAPIDLLADPLAGTPEEIVRRLAAEGIEAVRSPWAPLALTVTAGNGASSPARRVRRGRRRGRRGAGDGGAGARGRRRGRPRGGARRQDTHAPRDGARAPRRRARADDVARCRLAASLAAAGRRSDALVVRADAGTRAAAARPILLDPARRSLLGNGHAPKEPRDSASPEARRPGRFRAKSSGACSRRRSTLVAPGGTLVYVTCSLEPEENEDVVDALLGERPGFHRVVPQAAGLLAPLATAVSAAGFVRILPGATNDGFSAAVLRRESPR